MKLSRALLAGAAMTAVSAAQAASGSFLCISSPADCADGVNNNLTWSYDGSAFTILNGGSSGFFVSDVYFDFGSATDVSFLGGAGTAFTTPATPANLPGGDAYIISGGSWDSSWGADPPPAQNGINDGESASWSFASGQYVAGLHLQGLLNEGSASYVAVEGPPLPSIPEPQTYALLLAGLGVLGFVARRRNRTR